MVFQPKYKKRNSLFFMPIPNEEILEALLVLCQAIKDELFGVKGQLADLLDELTNDVGSAFSAASQFVDFEASDDDMDEDCGEEAKFDD